MQFRLRTLLLLLTLACPLAALVGWLGLGSFAVLAIAMLLPLCVPAVGFYHWWCGRL